MSDVEVLGPVPAYPARLRGRFRWHIVLRGADPRALLDKANLRSGCPQDGQLPPEPDWASDLRMTYAGIPEVGPQWLMEHRDAVTLLDVREPGEWQNEPLPAQLDTVVQIPIGSLADRVAEVPQGKPVVALCRSGKRSSLATGILRGAGFEQVASLHGGVLPLAQH